MVAFYRSQLLLAIRSRFTRRARSRPRDLLRRPQLIVLRRKSPTRVKLWNIDRFLLIWLYRLYPSLLDAIIIVQPETVIRWHNRGSAPCHWRWKSRQVGGRPRIDSGLRGVGSRYRTQVARRSWYHRHCEARPQNPRSSPTGLGRTARHGSSHHSYEHPPHRGKF